MAVSPNTMINSNFLRNFWVLLSLVIYSNNTFAQWQRLSGGPSADYTQYIDMSLLKLTDDGKWRVWELMDYQIPKISTTGKVIRSSKQYWEIDCKDFKHRVLSGSWFTGQMGSGESLGGPVRESEYEYIQPGSVGAYLATPLCSVK
jgi:hypothetical protein